MAAYSVLTTTDGLAAISSVPASQDRWLIAVRYMCAYFLGDVYRGDLRPAMPQEIAAVQAEHPHARFEWLADDP